MSRSATQLLASIMAGMDELGSTESPRRPAAPTPCAPEPADGLLGMMQLGGMVLEIAPAEERVNTGIMEGRAFTVAEVVRTAEAVTRTDWEDCPPIDTGSLDDRQRRALARHFVNLGVSEHASVASFNRAALELLYLGAPPRLLMDVQQAAMDEVRHARIAYGLAARYGSAARGPGSLDVRGALDDDLSREGIILRLLDEACIGETFAALRLREVQRLAVDPAFRAIIGGIGDDEETHAAMGWRALRWLVQGRPDLVELARHHVHQAFDRTPEFPDRDDELATYGLLSTETCHVLRQRAFLQVILPAVQALG